MSDQPQLDNTKQPTSEQFNITPSSDKILAKIGINSAMIKTIKQRNKRSSYRAVINWLTKYKPNPDASNLEKVRGLLEAFFHMCGIEEWEKASQIISIPLNTSANEVLHNQLKTW